MRVYKFGGASIANVERAQKVCSIIQEGTNDNLLVVISAMGKTTNALEEVVHLFLEKKKDDALNAFESIKQAHFDFAKDLLQEDNDALKAELMDLLTEVEWTLNEEPGRAPNYYYDQIVSVGEMLSTKIMSYFFNQQGIDCQWFDVRDLIRTNDQYKDAKVDWAFSSKKIKTTLDPILAKNKVVLTQGFVGATDENNSTTLGREGSDFSAAIFGSILEAKDVTIWKDVPALLNADPKQFDDTTAIKNISYREVIEMAFYGAQVIHPKTIKPLRNLSIPLQVKCFLDSALTGTTIQKQQDYVAYPPMMVWKKKQILIELSTKDFSFISEGNLALIYRIFHEQKVKMNIIQNGAIGFAACVDNIPAKIIELIRALSTEFNVKHSEGVDLLTIRHYTAESEEIFTKNREILLKQQTRTTLKYVLR